MDRKTFNRSRKPRKGKRNKSSPALKSPYSNPSLNQLMYKASWTVTTLQSGTTGAIASSLGVSIQNSSEYSSLASMYGEIRLVRARLTLMNRVPNSTSVNHARVTIGTNQYMNQTTFTLPSSDIDVQNLLGVRYHTTYSINPQCINMIVPRRLDHFNIAADVPTLVSPWGGSPGVFQIFGGGFTNSTDYIIVHVEAVWHVTARH